MKRIAFCFDGTWDRLGSSWIYPTNVVLTAQSITPRAAKGDIVQIIHYDQGVGTAFGTKYIGGIFGFGVTDTIEAAYRFLVFNYEIGDDIFVFGFSRGAFTARAFIGMIRSVGILRRSDAEKIKLAVEAYRKRVKGESHDSERLLTFRYENTPQVCVDESEDTWRCKQRRGYLSGTNPILKIRYLGLWDTVELIGFVQGLLAPWININGWLNIAQFFDADLSELVVTARHALAIDEQRVVFAPTLWSNSEALNASVGYSADSDGAPYQQRWFPGGHGSVGGGGPVRGLSDAALDWVISGARVAGLEIDLTSGSEIYSLQPNALSPLDNMTDYTTSFGDKIGNFFLNLVWRARSPGPKTVPQVNSTAITRWRATAEVLPEKRLYRPPTLATIKDALDRLIAQNQSDEPDYSPDALPTAPMVEPTPGSYYRVVLGDNLTKIAQRAYHDHDTSKIDKILHANWLLLNGNQDRIYIGQLLFIPQLPGPEKTSSVESAGPPGH